jgi:nitroreductase
MMHTPADILFKLAKQRKTVRKFKPEQPALERIMAALKMAGQAPSGSNKQPWQFLIIDDPGVKARVRTAAETGEKEFYGAISEEKRLAYEAMGNTWKKPMFEDAPVLVVVVSDTNAPNYRPSVWLAVGYLILALEAAGLHTVTYTPSHSDIVRKVLDIPDGFRVETILPIGFSADSAPKKPRKPLGNLVFYNHWNVPFLPDS